MNIESLNTTIGGPKKKEGIMNCGENWVAMEVKNKVTYVGTGLQVSVTIGE